MTRRSTRSGVSGTRTFVRLLVGLALVAQSFGCSGSDAASAPTPSPSPASPPPVAQVQAAPAAPDGPPSDEVCARAIVVQWQGAQGAPAEITRSEGDARVRAEALLQSIESGARSFEEVARADSDARSSGARGGLLGTYSHGDWPTQHVAIRERAFAMREGETSEVVQAPYGWVLLERCRAEYRHTRHVLIRFQGARNAGSVTRSRDQAFALATTTHASLAAGADFAVVARQTSEDGSASRGGDMGWLGRGRLAPSYEEAAFALAPHQLSGVVESEFGFHVIERME